MPCRIRDLQHTVGSVSAMHEPQEGVIKFTYEHEGRTLRDESLLDVSTELMAWRAIMRNLSLIGQIPELYDGAGYGNVSARFRPFPGERGHRRFVITGTQTGGLVCNTPDEYCLIEEYDTRKNFVRSTGPIEPSSETMTHGTLYDLDPGIRFVFHGHSRLLWPLAAELQIPITEARVPYGTPAMAEEVKRLFRTSLVPDIRIFAMGGHEDGVVVFGNTALEAGTVLIDYLTRAHKRQARNTGRLCD